MDAFSHALFGATLAQASAPQQPSALPPRHRLVLCGVAAVFPDVDFIGFPLDPLRFLADWHQGPTHSLILLPLWALTIGGAYGLACRRPGTLVAASALAGLGLASHIALDLMTAYGSAVFQPLSARRYAIGSLYLFDPVFLLIALVALTASVRCHRRGPAATGIALLVLYAAGQTLQQGRAIEVAQRWATARGLTAEKVVALAQPFSPFHWKLVVVDGPRYHEAHLDFGAGLPALPAPGVVGAIVGAYRPPAALAWRTRHRHGDDPSLRPLVEERWQDERFAAYRRFAVFPLLSRIERNGDTCVWFTDLRYDLPALPDTFRYGFCRDRADRPWRLYRLRYFSAQSRQAVGAGP